MLDAERDIIILGTLIGLSALLWRWRLVRFILLGAAAALDSAYILFILAMSLIPGERQETYIPFMFLFYISIPIVAATLFAFFARGKKIWHYFGLGCAIFMGLPFFLLFDWFV